MSLLRHPTSHLFHDAFGLPILRPLFGSSQQALTNTGASSDASTGALSDYFARTSTFGPRIDIHEEENKYALTAELPGLKREDVSIEADEKENRLTISGTMRSEYEYHEDMATTEGQQAEQKQKEKEKDKAAEGKKIGRPMYTERLFGSFSRSFNFPRSADLASVKARFDQGLLRIDVPKKAEEQQRTRKVEIEDVREKL